MKKGIKDVLNTFFKKYEGKVKLSEGFKQGLEDAYTVLISESTKKVTTLEAENKQLKEKNEKLAKGIPAKVNKLVEDYKSELVDKLTPFFEKKAKALVDAKTAKMLAEAEVYAPLVKKLKFVMENYGIKVDSKAHSVLKEAKGEILRLEKEANTSTAKYNKLKVLTKKLMVQEYLEEKCKGLTADQTSKIVTILGEAKSTKEVDARFKNVRDLVLNESTKVNDKEKTVVKDLNKRSKEKEENLGQSLI